MGVGSITDGELQILDQRVFSYRTGSTGHAYNMKFFSSAGKDRKFCHSSGNFMSSVSRGIMLSSLEDSSGPILSSVDCSGWSGSSCFLGGVLLAVGFFLGPSRPFFAVDLLGRPISSRGLKEHTRPKL